MTAESQRSWRSRVILVALFALFFAPVLGAMLVFVVNPGWTPFGTVNRGQLIEPPRPLDLGSARALDGGAALAERLTGKWVLVHLSGTPCSGECNASLLAIRQSRLALGKDADRVQRVWLVTGEPTGVTMQPTLREFPGMVAGSAPGALQTLFPEPAGDAVYIVDPAGLLILRYSGPKVASAILKDMKRLLKISKQG